MLDCYSPRRQGLYQVSWADTTAIIFYFWWILKISIYDARRFTSLHNFEKPSDVRGLGLMDAAAQVRIICRRVQ
jgi:tRNA(His) 5'-end guanylyltransferase